MATQSILVDDCSPLIQYSPVNAWRDSLANDTLATSYSGGSYHVTSTQGATATFQFRGTGFTITGGRRPGYGSYSVALDGQQIFNGTPPESDSDIKNTLSSTSKLSNDLHTVVLTNTGGAPIDIDTITFETADAALNTTTIDDTDPRITYLPVDVWELNPNPAFHNSTLHYSEAPNATASFNFTGSAIAFYGTVSPDHADISITIDDQLFTMPSGSASRVFAVRPQVLMFWADDLEDGQHTLTMTKVQSANAGPFVDVDSFVVYSSGTGEVNATASHTDSPDPHANSNKPTINRVGVIAGASVAAAIALLLIVLGVFLFFKRRRQYRGLGNSKSSLSPTTPTLPMQGMAESGMAQLSPTGFKGGNSPPSASLAPLRKASQRVSKLSIAPSYYGDVGLSDDGGTSGRRGGTNSSTPAIPRLALSRSFRTPGSLQTVSEMVATDNASSALPSARPLRPKRPPTLNLGSLDSLR